MSSPHRPRSDVRASRFIYAHMFAMTMITSSRETTSDRLPQANGNGMAWRQIEEIRGETPISAAAMPVAKQQELGPTIARPVRIGVAPDEAYASLDMCLVVAAPRNGSDVVVQRSGDRELHLYDKNRHNLQTYRCIDTGADDGAATSRWRACFLRPDTRRRLQAA
ncbi:MULTISPECIES: hypothetical protein [unclassified Lysobacter]|uniref:hypothetical protein n=1 Tax=unclassified Lysobacter TaxID=2635362 RepID=UPI001BE96624|nr:MULTISPECIES: hypothetical protein [unclassified Lysobacter]MBT2744786.1 hypothetical protein [Lysobacter sp. ISL-42]MBT2752221.1 hypothetical protein [Lysobacter sp. ISL-50]MBT2778718.1 hypothetical protein [Lysobacter sp. ISL-54]MBT2780351.1 hypothetical protein [Lysobacter sp. ISL-52]